MGWLASYDAPIRTAQAYRLAYHSAFGYIVTDRVGSEGLEFPRGRPNLKCMY